jgi:hypothetical protein
MVTVPVPANDPAPPLKGAAPANLQPATTQTAAAMVGITTLPSNNGDAGTRLTIAMAPPAIGMVSVQIDRASDGSSTIAVGATHPITLAALQTDHAAIDQMLTLAGVPVDHRSVTFHLDAAPTEGATTPAQTNTGPGGGNLGQGADRQPNDQAARGTPQNYDRRGNTTASPQDVGQPAAFPSAPLQLRRFGVNMMA